MELNKVKEYLGIDYALDDALIGFLIEAAEDYITQRIFEPTKNQKKVHYIHNMGTIDLTSKPNLVFEYKHKGHPKHLEMPYHRFSDFVTVKESQAGNPVVSVDMDGVYLIARSMIQEKDKDTGVFIVTTGKESKARDLALLILVRYWYDTPDETLKEFAPVNQILSRLQGSSL